MDNQPYFYCDNHIYCKPITGKFFEIDATVNPEKDFSDFVCTLY